MTVYPSAFIILGLDTVLVVEVEEHALDVLIKRPPTVPFCIRECGYSLFVG